MPPRPADDGREPDRSGRPPRAGVPLRTALALIILGALVLAAASAILSVSRPTRYTASASVLVRPDPPLTDAASTLSADQSDRLLQSQVIVMQALEKDRAAAAPASSTSLQTTITQVGLTDVIQVTVSAVKGSAAIQEADGLVDSYVKLQRRNVSNRVQATIDEANFEITAVNKRLGALADSTGSTQDQAATAALTAEYGRLISVINEVQLTAKGAQTSSVLRRAQDGDLEASSNGRRQAFLAGLLGAAIVVAVLVGWNRLRERRDGLDP